MAERGSSQHPAEALDIHVGGKIRACRLQRGLSLLKAGEIIGLSSQQMSRLELGHHRARASQVYRLAMAFDVPVSYFFEEFAGREDVARQLHMVLGYDRHHWGASEPAAQDEELLAALTQLPEDVYESLRALIVTLAQDPVR